MVSRSTNFRRFGLFSAAIGCALTPAGCRVFPVAGSFRADARVAADVAGRIDVRLPSATDSGPLVPSIVRPGRSGPNSPRIAVIDLDGLILNQNPTALTTVGENPVAVFREKLEAAARDPRVRGIVVRINSPGGGAAASDILAEELRRFRDGTGKPAVASLLDLAAGGAYLVAVGCDQIVASPTSIVGGIGAIVNHFNLQDAMAQFNVSADPIKSGDLVDMGSVTAPLSDEVRALLQEAANGFRDRFAARVANRRPSLTVADRKLLADGRVVPATRALTLHLVDRLGYPDDAIESAETLARAPGAEVVLYHRAGQAARTIYSVTSANPANDLVPFSYPGLDRAKLPTFLYLWQPDPTILRPGTR